MASRTLVFPAPVAPLSRKSPCALSRSKSMTSVPGTDRTRRFPGGGSSPGHPFQSDGFERFGQDAGFGFIGSAAPDVFQETAANREVIPAWANLLL